MLPGDSHMRGLSVIICCYNAALRLPETLRHLAMQEVPAQVAWEIILVDNASTDNSRERAQLEWDKYHFSGIPFYTTEEQRPGKTFALKTGVTKALYEYILICDDDNWLNADYIAKAIGILDANKEIGAVGGQSFAVADVVLPDWFSEFGYAYAVGKQDERSADLNGKRYLWGAGMVFRTSAYNRAYQKHEALLSGPVSDQLSRGEDVEFCMRLTLLGYRLRYDESLLFRHYMPMQRLTIVYKEELFKIHSYETLVLDMYMLQIRLAGLSALRKLMVLLLSIIKYALCYMGMSNRWSKGHEAKLIYLATGFRLQQVPGEAEVIRTIYLQRNRERDAYL
jgi:glycosyltransferase involved in cell wall biosynthesis